MALIQLLRSPSYFYLAYLSLSFEANEGGTHEDLWNEIRTLLKKINETIIDPRYDYWLNIVRK